MTKMEFEKLLDEATAGDVESMHKLVVLCFKMAEGSLNAGNTEKATIYMELGNGWKSLSEHGTGKVSEQIKRLTHNEFSAFF